MRKSHNRRVSRIVLPQKADVQDSVSSVDMSDEPVFIGTSKLTLTEMILEDRKKRLREADLLLKKLGAIL
jgi:hypothetical protein